MAKTTNTRFQILCKLLECGAGGGNRTIRAYSFYLTYCKHTNARTAQPAVCPPPMYKIMYKKFEGRVRRPPLNAGLRSSPSRIQETIRELPDDEARARGLEAVADTDAYTSIAYVYCGLC